MIPPNKSRLFTAWFARDASRRIARSFSAVRVRGLARLCAACDQGSVLVVSNHTAWWNPLVAIVLANRHLRADAYAMMDANNLARLPFFAKVGAFGVDLSDPRDGARAIRQATKLLARPRGLVWIFAQGREVPITVCPLGFRAGSAEIARIARHTWIAPIALRYEMGASPLPTLWISCAEPAQTSIREVTAERERQEQIVTDELDAIDRAIANGSDAASFETIYQRRESRWFALAQAALAWWVRPRGAHGLRRVCGVALSRACVGLRERARKDQKRARTARPPPRLRDGLCAAISARMPGMRRRNCTGRRRWMTPSWTSTYATPNSDMPRPTPNKTSRNVPGAPRQP